jgi:hypothetical protein
MRLQCDTKRGAARPIYKMQLSGAGIGCPILAGSGSSRWRHQPIQRLYLKTRFRRVAKHIALKKMEQHVRACIAAGNGLIDDCLGSDLPDEATPVPKFHPASQSTTSNRRNQFTAGSAPCEKERLVELLEPSEGSLFAQNGRAGSASNWVLTRAYQAASLV